MKQVLYADEYFVCIRVTVPGNCAFCLHRFKEIIDYLCNGPGNTKFVDQTGFFMLSNLRSTVSSCTNGMA